MCLLLRSRYLDAGFASEVSIAAVCVPPRSQMLSCWTSVMLFVAVAVLALRA